MLKKAIKDNSLCLNTKNNRDNIIRIKKGNLNIAKHRRHEIKIILEMMRNALNAESISNNSQMRLKR